jgi:hypothetical protein
MAHTTPARLRRDAIMTLSAPLRHAKGTPGGRSTAWDGQTRPTLAAAMAWGRRQLWPPLHLSTSPQESDLVTIPRTLWACFTAALCSAA